MEEMYGRKSDPADWGKPAPKMDKKKLKRKRKSRKETKKQNR